MFAQATRLKLRFNTPLGSVPVEDLWSLPLLPQGGNNLCLDNLARSFHRELKADNQESFVLKRAKPDEKLQLKFDLVKHIIAVLLEENEAAENAMKAKEKKDMIMAIIVDKEANDLKGKSLEDLRSLLDSL